MFQDLGTHENIYTPAQYRKIIEDANNSKSSVVDMETHFYEFDKLATLLNLKNQKANSLKEKVNFRDEVKWIRIERHGFMLYKNSLDPFCPFIEVELLDDKTAIVNFESISIPALRKTEKTGEVSELKAANIREQLKYVPKTHRWYYEKYSTPPQNVADLSLKSQSKLEISVFEGKASCSKTKRIRKPPPGKKVAVKQKKIKSSRQKTASAKQAVIGSEVVDAAPCAENNEVERRSSRKREKSQNRRSRNPRTKNREEIFCLYSPMLKEMFSKKKNIYSVIILLLLFVCCLRCTNTAVFSRALFLLLLLFKTHF